MDPNSEPDEPDSNSKSKWRTVGYILLVAVVLFLAAGSGHYSENKNVAIGIVVIAVLCWIAFEAKLLPCSGTENRQSFYTDDVFEDVVVPEDVEKRLVSMVCEELNCNYGKARSLIRMLESGKTVSFLVRYREKVVGGWSPKDVRHFHSAYEKAKNVITRVDEIKDQLSACDRQTVLILNALDKARTEEELNFISETYLKKPTVPEFKAQKLTELAEQILSSYPKSDVTQIVGFYAKYFDSFDEINSFLPEYIAEAILKKLDLKTVVWRNKDDWTLKSVKNPKIVDVTKKFKDFYEFDSQLGALRRRPDRILKMNRGEKKKILQITLVPGNSLTNEIDWTLNQIMIPSAAHSGFWMMEQAKAVARTKKLTILSAEVRKDLTERAEDVAIEVFRSNFKRLLLTPPFKNDSEFHVLGVDPGYSHGCKAVIANSKTFGVLDNNLIHLGNDFEGKLKNLLSKWGVRVVVVGNGVGHRHVLKGLSNIVQLQEFSGVKFTLVRENGVSEYSTSEVGEREYPGYHWGIISAVGLIRRLFDPLQEFSKMDPKHLGIGIYQHDVDRDKLVNAARRTVSEVIAIIGVDVNTASASMLSSVPGLDASIVASIIDHRKCKGPFKNRNQLQLVRGMKGEIFQQCAGFLRILPPSNVKDKEYNVLDQTLIHPYYYKVTYQLLELMGLPVSSIGTTQLTDFVRGFSTEKFADLLKRTGVGIDKNYLVRGLSPYWISSVPSVLKYDVTKMDELRVGMMISGEVENVTLTEAFVSIGIDEVNAVLPFNDRNKPDLGLGDRVQVEIRNLEINGENSKIGLTFKRKISDHLRTGLQS